MTSSFSNIPHYEAMDFSSNGRLDMPESGLSLGLWRGEFERISNVNQHK